MRESCIFLFSLFIFPVIISSCESNTIGQSKDVSQDQICQLYRVSYNEADDYVESKTGLHINPSENTNISAQFCFAGNNGTTLVLSQPSHCELDGQVLQVDSTHFAGAYYVPVAPLDNFIDKQHHFLFTDINNKKYDNGFSFEKLRLLTTIPLSISRKKPFELKFDPASLKNGDVVTISTTIDTDSFFSVQQTVYGNNCTLSIPKEDLEKQTGKELRMQVSFGRDVPLQQNTAIPGDLFINCALKSFKVGLED